MSRTPLDPDNDDLHIVQFIDRYLPVVLVAFVVFMVLTALAVLR